MSKRTKQVDKMVESVNDYLRGNRIISNCDTVFLVVSGALLDADTYRGFNWFYFDEQGVKRLVGSGDEEVVSSKDGFIQFY